MRAANRLLTPIFLVLALAACATARRAQPSDQPETTVEVENRNFLDMRIYVYRGGQRVRLGNVPGLSTRVMVIPESLLFGPTPLRFLADPIGGRASPVSHEITVSPGDQVQMVIPSS